MPRTEIKGARAPFQITIILLVTLFALSCSKTQSASEKRGDGAPENQAEAQPIAITVAKTESREVPATIQATGSLVPEETSNIAPKVAGKVANVMVNVGQFVQQGAVVAKIDDREPRLRLAEAQAGVKQAVAAVRQAEARLGLGPNGRFDASMIPEVRAAASNYEQALAEQRQAEANEKRYRELVETGDVPMITYEQYRTTRDTARARAASAKQQLDAAANAAKQSNQAIRSAEAAVEAARAQVNTAEQAVADTTVRAPFAGYISERQTAVGEYVTSSSIIATILRTNPIKIQIRISEADVPQVAIGAGISIQVDAYPDRSFAGRVTAVNPAVDPASRSAIVEGSIENGNNALRTGMFATAKINRAGGQVGVFVPKTAVYNDQSTQSRRAFVIVDGIAKLKVLQIGTEEGGFVQVLDGLAPDEVVATSNLDQLYEGAKVVY